jgi:hypothetical protein
MSDTFAESSDEQKIHERRKRRRNIDRKYYVNKKKKIEQQRRANETSDSSDYEVEVPAIVCKDVSKSSVEEFEILLQSEVDLPEVSFNKIDSESSLSTSSYTDEEDQAESSESVHGFSSSEEDKEKTGDLLYTNANTSLLEFLLTMSSIRNKHNLSEVAVNEILSVFRLVLPRGNKVPKNLNLLEKKAISDQDGEHFKICSRCNMTKSIGSLKTLKCSSDTCESCEKKMTSFVIFDLKSQLTKILTRKQNIDQIIKCQKKSRET